VKKLLLCTTLLVSLPVCAAEPAPTVPKTAPKSDVMDAFSLASEELKLALGHGKGNPIPLLDKMATFEYSEATRARLTTVFGHAHPLSIARAPAPKGKVVFDVGLQAHSYRDQEDVLVSWTPLKMKLQLDQAGRSMDSSGSWASLDIAGTRTSVNVADMRLRFRQRRNPDDIWLGQGSIDIARVGVGPKGQAAELLMEGIRIDTATLARGKGYDIGSDFRVKTVSAGGVKVDAVRVALRATNVDVKALEALSTAIAASSAGGSVPQEQQLAAMLPAAKAFARTVAARGSAVEIDEISAGYRGNRAVIKGKVGLAGAVDADFDSLAALGKKVVARFEIKLPVALITDIATAVSAKQAAAAQTQGQAHPNLQSMAAAGQSIADMIVGKLLNGGYARLEKGVLVSVIEYKAGQLSANGKAVQMPAKPVPIAAPAAPSTSLHAQRLGATNMGPRPVSDRCKLLPLPAEAARQNRTLEAEAMIEIGADGKVGSAVITRSSEWPGFDEEILANERSCPWIPALVDGKEVASKMRRVFKFNGENGAPAVPRQ